MSLGIRAFSAADARAVGSWQYPERYALYDVDEQALLAELDHYRGVVDSDDDALVGFYCTGPAARVAGLPVNDAVVDLGLGMRPDRVGRGDGATFGQAVLTHLANSAESRTKRVVVQSWNQRARRLACRLGFSETGVHVANDVEFIILIRR